MPRLMLQFTAVTTILTDLPRVRKASIEAFSAKRPGFRGSFSCRKESLYCALAI
jgi:hypothetical protein